MRLKHHLGTMGRETPEFYNLSSEGILEPRVVCIYGTLQYRASVVDRHTLSQTVQLI